VSRPREVPCEGGCGAYTSWRFCDACQDKRRAARTVSTPETRAAEDRWAGFGARATLPTLDPSELPPIDRTVAVSQLRTCALVLEEPALRELLAHAERLRVAS
jgi:hypothetical protein